MTKQKFFTLDQANAMLPLVQRIVQDITILANDLRERVKRFRQLQQDQGENNYPNTEEMDLIESELEQGKDRMEELEGELRELGILLKDYFTGLIDFPCWKDGREIYLCWKLGEPEIGHWHEIDAGFAGRQKLRIEARTK